MADDEFIPFDPPIVSKYGPISRMSKTILRPNSSVQVSASFGDGTISTPMVRRPVPAASPVASWYFNAAQGEFQYTLSPERWVHDMHT
jgi:RING finger/CCCH-type zinc finger protein